MKLILPYPVSANRYWQSFAHPHTKHVITIVSSEAKRYKRQVKIAAFEQGAREPLTGRVFVAIALYPNRPLDFQKRMRIDPMNWDDTVQCLDLDNARKVLYDALKGIAFEDDSWVRRDAGERMEPDAEGARVVVTIEPIVRQSPQVSLLEAAA